MAVLLLPIFLATLFNLLDKKGRAAITRQEE